MHAIVRATRIDIKGANGLPQESWEPTVDELKAVRTAGLSHPLRHCSATRAH
jgi:hypothetical protein